MYILEGKLHIPTGNEQLPVQNLQIQAARLLVPATSLLVQKIDHPVNIIFTNLRRGTRLPLSFPA